LRQAAYGAAVQQEILLSALLYRGASRGQGARLSDTTNKIISFSKLKSASALSWQMPDRQEIHRWYCSANWLRRRAHQLRVEPLCRICLEAGRVVPATVADHIENHKGDFTAFRLGELRSLSAE
jgi:hypothetical protein